VTLVVLILAVATILLWRRVDQLEKQVRQHGSPAAAAPQRVESLAVEPERIVDSEAVQPVEPLPPAAPRPVPVDAVEETARERPRFSSLPKLTINFEEMFGRLLPIWAGGIALAVAGFFLVRYAIEAGLLTPAVRVALSFGFGLALLAAAELAYRFELRVRDVRVRQALAGAGLATLYASFYLAGSLYGLIGTTIAFLGLAAVTAAAIALSFRFGLPSAILGLVGGFAAPTLVGGAEPNVPLLATYLALVTAGLSFTGERQGRSWLGWVSLGGGLVWGVMLLLSGTNSLADVAALGLYLVLIGALLPALLSEGPLRRAGRIGAATLSTLQMAALIDEGGFGLLAWGLYGLLGAALAFFGWRRPAMREASAVAAAVALWMLALWPDPRASTFTAVAAPLLAIFAGAPLAHVWRGDGRRVDFVQLSGFSLGLSAVTYVQFGDWGASGVEPGLALTTAALAALPALAAWRCWPARGERIAWEPLGALASAALGLFAAGLMATPAWSAPLVAAAIAAGLLALTLGRDDARLANLAWAGAAVTVLALAATPAFVDESDRLFGLALPVSWRAVLRWASTALPFALLAVVEHRLRLRPLAEATGALLAYGFIAQFVPPQWLASVAAVGAIAAAWRWPERPVVALTFLAVAALWALEPIALWGVAGAEALLGRPAMLDELPEPRMTLTRLLPLALGAAAIAWLVRGTRFSRWLNLGAGASAVVVLHLLYKRLFAIGSPEMFRDLGLAERTVWEALLLGAAIAVSRLQRPLARIAAQAIAAAALAHFAWFTLLLHNPLWAEQAVGPWPLANLLVPAYGVALAALLWLRREFVSVARLRPAFDAVAMLLIALFALSELRQAYSGSLLSAKPLFQTEELLRSLLGIVLAIGFLGWGSRSGERSWRLGSLVLMLLALLKVFLLDTAGLTGLARIASFLALGLSLIGLGWYYSRQLKPAVPPAPA